jgi:DNA-binding transcriptional MocR family regulator
MYNFPALGGPSPNACIWNLCVRAKVATAARQLLGNWLFYRKRFTLVLNQRMDTRDLLPCAIECGVAFMPGELFYPDPTDGLGKLRLNFSHASEREADRGLRILAELLAQRLQQVAERSSCNR